MNLEYEKRLLRQQKPHSISTPSSHRRQSLGCIYHQEKYGDRFIPTRACTARDIKFTLENEMEAEDHSYEMNNISKKNLLYVSLLEQELLGQYSNSSLSLMKNNGVLPFRSLNNNLFSYKINRSLCEGYLNSNLSLSPLSAKSHKILQSPQKSTRIIPLVPFKVLDAPELQDDFYLNLVDWSSQNVLSVGLGNGVYLWSASSGQVICLCNLEAPAGTFVTSVSWNEKGNLLAVGTMHGDLQIWDTTVKKQVLNIPGHETRVAVTAWNCDSVCSGSRDRIILLHDVRSPTYKPIRRLNGHQQEVCGLKWSHDKQHLASGGNDNRLLVWNHHSSSPMHVFNAHRAAVKGISWSPHQQGILASGGGTADRCIRFWNILSGQSTHCIDTGSQVCNLAWSKNSSELVSTHGYSQNQIIVWKYPSLVRVTTLTGHTCRVLYLAMSPDGGTIVTGAGDETLRLWNIFDKVPIYKRSNSVLNLFGAIR